MKFDVFNRFSGAVQFTAEIECSEDTITSVKLGLAVKWAVKSGASLNGASLNRANLYGASLYGANLDGANLDGASLNGASLYGASLYGASLNGANLNRANLNRASGINDWVKCIQIEDYPITYTAEVMQIGCQRHAIAEWAAFDDTRIIQMDGKRALAFWRKWKGWIFQTIEMAPAKPTGYVAPEARQ